MFLFKKIEKNHPFWAVVDLKISEVSESPEKLGVPSCLMFSLWAHSVK